MTESTRLPPARLRQNASPADDARQDRKAQSPDRDALGLRDVPVHNKEMPMMRCADHKRSCRLLLLGERQELRRKLAHHVAIERHKFATQKP